MHLRSEQSPAPRWLVPALGTLALVVLGGAATTPGAAVVGSVQRFLAFYAGVCALVGLSVTVVLGLTATERTLLGIRHRVFAQSVHRASAVASMAFLVAHIFIKVLAGHTSVASIVVVQPNSVGLGTLAFELYVLIFITGVARAFFAHGRRPWLWRSLHALAYLCWPVAIAHGLTAGRTAAGWVLWGYALCLVAVFLAVLARLLMRVRPGAYLGADDPAYGVAARVTEEARSRVARS